MTRTRTATLITISDREGRSQAQAIAPGVPQPDTVVYAAVALGGTHQYGPVRYVEDDGVLIALVDPDRLEPTHEIDPEDIPDFLALVARFDAPTRHHVEGRWYLD